MNLAHLLITQARRRPDALALVEGPAHRPHQLTFAELDTRSSQAAALLRRCGIGAGNPVLVFVPMSIELYIILVALIRIGAIATFLDPSAGRQHIARCCQMLPPAALIAISRAHLLRLTTPPLRRIGRAFFLGWPVPGAARWKAYQRLAPDPTIAERTADDPALITFTSGSTNQPKAAVRSHGLLAAQHAALTRALDLQPGQVDLATLPIFTLANLASGVTSILPDADLRHPGQVTARPILRQMRAHRTTRCVASPAFFERLLSDPDAPAAFATMQRIDTGGAPVFPGLLQRLQKVMPAGRIVALYGSTEAEPIAHIAWDEMGDGDRAAMVAGRGLLAGSPVPEIDLRIITNQWGTPIDPLDAESFAARFCQPNEPGEIVVSGDHVLPGYLHGAGDRETKFRVDGRIWHRTGDAGCLDERGRLWLLGRAQARLSDDRGTLYPFAVEAAACAVAGVRRSALVQVDGKRVLVIEPAAKAPSDLPAIISRQLAWAHLDQVRPMKSIPVDKRHNAKIDYPALMQRLGKGE